MARRSAFFLCVLLALTGSADASPLQLRRGVSIHEWLNWSPIPKPPAAGNPTQDASGQAPSTPYVWPPYSRNPSPISVKDLQAIRERGFDFVRLSVDPGPMLSVSGQKRAEALTILGDAVKLALSSGLKVVFDFHPVGQVPAYSLTALNVAANEPAAMAYREMVAETAAFLNALVPNASQLIAIDLFNEPQFYPCDGVGGRKWKGVLSALVKAVRAVAPDLTLIVSGACGGNVKGLMNIGARQLADPNLLYSFHYYEPLTFSHQGTDARKWLTGVPWPTSVRTLDQSIALGTARLQAQTKLTSAERVAAESEIRKQLQKYYADDKGQQTVEAAFTTLIGWGRANGIRPEHFFMGEFGAMAASASRGGAAEADRLRWLTAVRQQAEKHGIGWAYWEYSNIHGMSLTRGARREFDPIALQALGLSELKQSRRGETPPSAQ
jgi:aryl-phospho-beta-D-glucosidase BglC (GH1 family)